MLTKLKITRVNWITKQPLIASMFFKTKNQTSSYYFSFIPKNIHILRLK